MSKVVPEEYYFIPPYYRMYIFRDSIKFYSDSKRLKGAVMKVSRNKDGYPQVGIRKNGQRNFLVHRLVAEAVYGPCPKGMEVNHKDGNKLNNHPSNLEYVTKAENIKHSYAQLGRIGAQGNLKHGLYAGLAKKEASAIYRSMNRELINRKQREKYALAKEDQWHK